MYEFLAVDPDIIEQRSDKYAIVAPETIHILGGIIDEFIEDRKIPRFVIVTEEKIVEGTEHSALLADMGGNYAYSWPLTERRLRTIRTRYFADDRAGDFYTLAMEWKVCRDDLMQPSYSVFYRIDVPDEEVSDGEPSMMICYEPALALLGRGSVRLCLEDFFSGYFEADKLLNSIFYKYWSRATEYDAENLFEDLSSIDASLHVQNERL